MRIHLHGSSPWARLLSLPRFLVDTERVHACLTERLKQASDRFIPTEMLSLERQTSKWLARCTGGLALSSPELVVQPVRAGAVSDLPVTWPLEVGPR